MSKAISRDLSRRRASRRARGTSMVEFAIMAPILVALVLWANYFWEVQVARIKAAEVARYVAFERTVRPDLPGILSEARQRYSDLDGASKTGKTPLGFTNQFNITVNGKLAAAPISGSLSETGKKGGGGLSGIMGTISKLVGDSVEAIIGLLGFKTNQGAVEASVEIKVKNRIIPKEVAGYVTGAGGDALDLTFRDKFFVYHDTWRAWGHGMNPVGNSSYTGVQQKVYDRVKKVAYLGLTDAPGVGDVLNAIGGVLDMLKLEFPFSTNYIKKVTLIRAVPENGNGNYTAGGRPTRTVPGDMLQANYYKNDWNGCWNNCEPDAVKNKRGVKNSSGWDDNWPMRAYRCRGDYFQGAKKSDEPESVYSQNSAKGRDHFNYGNDACE